MKKTVTHLLDSFKPENYQLTLEILPKKNKFVGTVFIRGRKVGRPSKRITFHQKNLKITEAAIVHHSRSGEEEIEVQRINLQKSFDEVRLHTSKTLHSGSYTVQMKFSGDITDPMNGLYPCYFNHDQQQKKLFATQFESHHAREVFPSIDEPAAKATFDLTLITPDDEGTVLANTPVLEQFVSEGRKQTTFETTPIMSTYLLAFVYGEIGYKEAATNRGTKVRTYATPDNVKFTDFALETGVKILEFYEDYFDIPYPLEKCDMIALPDFASGAMENWGLITYREQCMLVDPDNTSLPTKQYVAMVVAHELAHQWFGNLVTMEWWTDLWLNEGFASWIEYLAVDHLFPDWDMWTQFIAGEQQSALKLDSLDNTHPIEVPINHPDEIRSIFDAISYNKGASVIHMLHGYLGEKDFRNGLRHYLNQHAYKNTSTNDLWSSLEKISGKPVKKFMHAWTSLPGFPLVKVETAGKDISLKQERFYMQKPAKAKTLKWPVPLMSSKDMPERLDNLELTVKNISSADGLMINTGRNGFYRSLYSADLNSLVAARINKLKPLDRLGILADSFETAKAGYGTAVESFKLLEKYSQEDNAAVWDIIAANIGETRRVMDDEKVRESIKPLIINLTSSQIDRLGTSEKKSDTHFDKLLRPTVLGLAASADHPEIVKWCIDSFNNLKSSEDIHADLRSVIFNTAARHGDEKVYKKLLSLHDATDLSEERTTLAAAMTSFEQPKLIEKALSLVVTDKVRRQDAMYWVAYSFMNRHAKKATWEWMKDNWGWLKKELGSDLSFYRTPIYAARSFSDKSFLSEFNTFFKSKSSPSLERSIKQGEEILNWQIAWRDRDLELLQRHLAN